MVKKLNQDNTSTRASNIRPFYVMDILARARRLEEQGKSIIHLEVGEPDFTTPQPVIDAGIRSLQQFKTHYTPACGLPELRRSISVFYKERFKLDVAAERIIITPGASGALQLALAAITDAGDQILLPEPGYPCNRNIAHVLGIDVADIIVDESSDYQLNAHHIDRYWTDKTRAAMVSTPSNPTGTMLSRESMASLIASVGAKQGHLIVDEIYQGLVYEEESYTALACSDDVFVINSFSKYFGMTGWRLGWMVVPEGFIDAVDRIAQNLFLAPATMSQYAALEAFSSDTIEVLENRVAIFKERRDYLLSVLPSLGFRIRVKPTGAFYLYADCSGITQDAFQWTQDVLEHTGVAITPGIDFGEHGADSHLRFAYTRPIDELKEAVSRLRAYIRQRR